MQEAAEVRKTVVKKRPRHPEGTFAGKTPKPIRRPLLMKKLEPTTHLHIYSPKMVQQYKKPLMTTLQNDPLVKKGSGQINMNKFYPKSFLKNILAAQIATKISGGRDVICRSPLCNDEHLNVLTLTRNRYKLLATYYSKSSFTISEFNI